MTQAGSIDATAILVMAKEEPHAVTSAASVIQSFVVAVVVMMPRFLDHDEFGSNRSKLINVIDSNIIARDSREKPVSTFSHAALEQIPSKLKALVEAKYARCCQYTVNDMYRSGTRQRDVFATALNCLFAARLGPGCRHMALLTRNSSRGM